jgi:hypothetical protein
MEQVPSNPPAKSKSPAPFLLAPRGDLNRRQQRKRSGISLLSLFPPVHSSPVTSRVMKSVDTVSAPSKSGSYSGVIP